MCIDGPVRALMLDCQADVLSHLPTHCVVPLSPADVVQDVIAHLNPVG